MPPIESVAVVGAGTMGAGISQVFAHAGIRVALCDIDEAQVERALEVIGRNLDRQIERGKLEPSERQRVLDRIDAGTDSSAAAARTDLVIEAAVERFDTKKQILESLDAAAPENVILATNTSSISITALGAVTSRPDRVVGMHFFNPVPAMKLVEVVRGLETSNATTNAVLDLARRLGKEPVAVNDSPGFVANRVLMPMINEAVWCVQDGVAQAEDVDAVMKLGMAHPMGPLALADLIGLDVCLSILEVLHREMGDDKYRPCPLLRRLVAAGRLGRKTSHGFYSY